MEQILPGVYRVLPTKPTPSKYISFLVTRPEGNLLIPCFTNQSTLRDRFDEITSLGGVRMQLLGDSHFKSCHCDEVSVRFHAPLYCSSVEAPDVRAGVKDVVEFPFERHMLAPGVEVIPTPGHRPGGVCYLVEQAGRRILFTGDTIWHTGIGWFATPITRGRAQMVRSLEELTETPFDTLMCNAIVSDPEYRLDFATDADRRAFMARVLAVVPRP